MTGEHSNSFAGRVVLRDVEARDLPELFRHEQDPEAGRMAVVNPRSADAFARAWARNMSDPATVAKAVVVDGEVVGTISCFDWDGLRSVGYWIAREHWGKGVATRALGLLLEGVTERPVHARVARSNAASLRVLEKGGFRITGYAWADATERFPACEEALLVLD